MDLQTDTISVGRANGAAGAAWLVGVTGAAAGESAISSSRADDQPQTLARSSRSARSLVLFSTPEVVDPVSATAGPVGLVFDGVLYNDSEVRAQLGLGEAEHSATADLILQAYLAWGKDVLKKIKGVFALIVFDGRDDQVLFARDPIGIYPLFYSEIEGELLLSPLIDALFRHPRTPRTLNRAAIADHVFNRWPDLAETFYAHIARVPQGSAVRITDRSREVYRYWDPAPPGAPVNWVREDEVARFEELLDQAVSRCLAFGRAGVYLSGGLDSVSVATVAADICRRGNLPLPLAFSLAFPGAAAEEDVQRGVAAGLGMQQIMIPVEQTVGPQGLLESGLEHTADWPMPFVGPWRPAYARLDSEAIRADCHVVLTGSGGDEWLTITPLYAADLLRDLNFAGLYRLAASTMRSTQLSPLSVARGMLWRFGARPLISAGAQGVLRRVAPRQLRGFKQRRMMRPIPSWFAPDPALREELEDRYEATLARHTRWNESFYLSDIRAGIEHSVVAMEMESAFETGRRCGLHHRAPYWDADLVDFLYRVSPELLIQGGWSKGLVRDMLARRLPGLGFERQKKMVSLSVFASEIMRDGPAVWKARGGTPALAALGIVDPSRLEVAVESVFAGTSPLSESSRVWQVLNLDAWVQPRLARSRVA